MLYISLVLLRVLRSKGLVCVKCEPTCVCLYIDVCVQSDWLDPVSCVRLCLFTGLCICINMLCVQSSCFPSSELCGASSCGIRSSAGRTRPSSSPVCREDPRPWQTELFASARVRLPRILRPPWTPAGAFCGAAWTSPTAPGSGCRGALPPPRLRPGWSSSWGCGTGARVGSVARAGSRPAPSAWPACWGWGGLTWRAYGPLGGGGAPVGSGGGAAAPAGAAGSRDRSGGVRCTGGFSGLQLVG